MKRKCQGLTYGEHACGRLGNAEVQPAIWLLNLFPEMLGKARREYLS